ncbi:MAG TPA: LysR family transcriptional regulator [Caulobacteraceae bacterium]|nr:LysR family transcriptional regulator [Caulobacteraceae bacterium]
MELRQLRYFKTIADARSFVRGADHLHVAQSALSRSIAKLEEEVGCPLFVRHSDGVTLTDAGALLYEHCERVLRQVQQLKDEMAADLRTPRGPVTLGAVPSLQSRLTSPVAARCIKAFPEVRLTVVQETSVRLREGVLAGQLDLVVCSTLAPMQGLRCVPLFSENMFLIYRDRDGAALGPDVTIENLVGVPLIICGFPNTLGLYLDRAFAEIGEKPTIRCEANSAAVVADLVAQGAGVGVAPPGVLSLRNSDGLRAAPIRGPSASWVLATSFERMGSTAVQQLSAMIVDHVRTAIAENRWPTAVFDGPPPTRADRLLTADAV